MSIDQIDTAGPVPAARLDFADGASLRRKIVLTLASVFIVYHVIGMAFVGPSSDSYLRNKLWPYYETYLATLRLGGGWSFYAPNPPYGTIMSYQAVGENGQTQIHPLSHARHKFERGYFLYTNFFNYALADPADSARKGYIASMVRYLCGRPGDFPVYEITFIEQSQKKFRYTDYLNGSRPLDPDFLEETRHGPYTCGE